MIQGLTLRNDIELWLPVPGTGGKSWCSSHGRVRGPSGRVLKPKDNGKGYLVVWVYYLVGRSQRYIHQLVLETFVGPRPEGHEACHYDDVRQNNNLSNLSWGAPGQNYKDKIRNGCFAGSKNPMAKLTQSDVDHIRELAETMPVKDIAAKFDVLPSCIRRIIKRQRWDH